ncbi:MAG: globin [Rhodoplanes sp.]|uniref:globin domain-containing protein n=1 Tax=Rhodoplanes sp. TaxID=1968906 RepID=UPI0017DCE158|nr:globin domain-containing protein [Rhodoplanes sp.]NVO12438.1 globin [Rhodoplanes sp.]
MTTEFLSADDIAHVRTSFDRIWSGARRLSDVFYEHLFEAVPEVRPMFRGDIEEQKRKFIGTLAVIVGSLENPAVLLPAAEKLAQQHVDYGVTPLHYSVVGTVLLASLARCLDGHWTPEVADAWTKAYRVLTAHMIATAYA